MSLYSIVHIYILCTVSGGGGRREEGGGRREEGGGRGLREREYLNEPVASPVEVWVGGGVCVATIEQL